MQIPYDKFQYPEGERKGRREREGRARERGEVNIMGRREPLLIHHSREIVQVRNIGIMLTLQAAPNHIRPITIS